MTISSISWRDFPFIYYFILLNICYQCIWLFPFFEWAANGRTWPPHSRTMKHSAWCFLMWHDAFSCDKRTIMQEKLRIIFLKNWIIVTKKEWKERERTEKFYHGSISKLCISVFRWFWRRDSIEMRSLCVFSRWDRLSWKFHDIAAVVFRWHLRWYSLFLPKIGRASCRERV